MRVYAFVRERGCLCWFWFRRRGCDGIVVFVTLTLQNIWPGKAGGSKTPRKRSQTQLVHLLVSSPICASLFPVRHVFNRQNKVCTFSQTETNTERNEIFFLCVTPGTYRADGDGPSRPFAQQLI